MDFKEWFAKNIPQNAQAQGAAYSKSCLEEAFNAGKKDIEPWHYPSKDPQDLPRENEHVLVLLPNILDNPLRVLKFNTNYFYSLESDFCINTVYAWKEIDIKDIQL